MEDVRARGDGLSLERLRLEASGHLPGDGSGQPIGHRRLHGLAAAERREAYVPVLAGVLRAAGGRDVRRALRRYEQQRDRKRQREAQQRGGEYSSHVVTSFFC